VISKQRERGILRGGISTQWLESILYVLVSDVAMALLPAPANRLAVGSLCVAYIGLVSLRYWRDGKAGAGVTGQDLAGVIFVALGSTALWVLPFPVGLLAAGFVTMAYLGMAVTRSRRAGRQGAAAEAGDRG
jgi:hypothetical protein